MKTCDTKRFSRLCLQLLGILAMDIASIDYMLGSYPESDNEFIFVDLPEDFPLEDFSIVLRDTSNGELKCENSNEYFLVSSLQSNEKTHCVLLDSKQRKGFDFGSFKYHLKVSRQCVEEENIETATKKASEFNVLYVEYINLNNEIKPLVMHLEELKQQIGLLKKGTDAYVKMRDEILREYKVFEKCTKEKVQRYLDLHSRLLLLKNVIK